MGWDYANGRERHEDGQNWWVFGGFEVEESDAKITGFRTPRIAHFYGSAYPEAFVIDEEAFVFGGWVSHEAPPHDPAM
jgi:hypothetical protein